MAGRVETVSKLMGAERKRTSRGFTLLEMLLVMMLATLVLTLVPANFSAVVPHVERQAEVRHFISVLRSARGAAIRERRAVTLMLDVKRHQYYLAGSEQVKALPKRLAIHYSAPFSSVANEPLVAIRFFADGSSSGGLIEMTMEGEMYHITIDWLTGKVSYREKA